MFTQKTICQGVSTLKITQQVMDFADMFWMGECDPRTIDYI